MASSDQQAKHLRLWGIFIGIADELGYKLTAGDAYRNPSVFGVRGKQGCAPYGNAYSSHKERMAHDANLFLDARRNTYGFLEGGAFATASEDWRELAKVWEELDPENRSGIRYNDGNHCETIPGHDNRKDDPL